MSFLVSSAKLLFVFESLEIKFRRSLLLVVDQMQRKIEFLGRSRAQGLCEVAHSRNSKVL